MKLTKGQRGKWGIFAAFLLFTLLLSACGSANTGNNSPSSTSTASGSNGKGCHKIGISFPETNTSYRWDNQDKPDLINALETQLNLPASDVLYQNANGDPTLQQTQAQSEIAQGACILVVSPNNTQSAAAIVTMAKSKGVPVISYDRMIASKDIVAYVSFDGVAVGKLQGQYIADHYQQYVTENGNKNIAIINGAQTDSNALAFKTGLHDNIDPLIQSGKLTNVYEQFTDWTAPVAQQDIQAALSKTNNKLAVAYVANDDMANSVITALGNAHLAGKVLVTGQDASQTGIQNIMLGKQTMTVYKNFKLEANATANVVQALVNGQPVSSVVKGTYTDPASNITVPAILEQPEAVDKSNVSSTILKDGFYTKAYICKGLPAGTDGIC
ncbi:MAG TPA: substrate-binding domain-containing protein [Dictyobacter sp.]|jgi:D-xylose transport system substrate-binding protein|nr:substrate-binding domain-containing protein [Dictyobacter sp.]